MGPQPPAVTQSSPVLAYGRGRARRQPVVFLWAEYPPGTVLNVIAICLCVACLIRDGSMIVQPVGWMAATAAWIVLLTIWAGKFACAARGRSMVLLPVRFGRTGRWLLIPLLCAATGISHLANLPVRTVFMVNYPSLRAIAETVGPRTSYQPAHRTLSFTIIRRVHEGPRVTLYTSGFDGNDVRKRGFQWVKDGSEPAVAPGDQLIPMGFGWYVFYDDHD